MKKVKLFEEFLNEATAWDKVRAKSKEMFGEWVLDALEEDEIAQLIDIPEADRIASKYFNEYTFMGLSLGEMGKLINKYPKVVKESLDEAMQIDASGYKRVHGKDPKGTGKWAFYFDKNERDIFFTPTAMSYGDAVKWAKEQAKDAGKSIIYVGESLNENFPGPGETVDAKDLDYDMLDYFNRTNKKLSIDTKTKKGIKGSVGKMFGDLVFNGDAINKKDIVKVKILESNDSIINEDMMTQLLFSFIMIAQAAAIGGQIGMMVAKHTGTTSPIEDLKNWWNSRKRDKAVQSIVAKLQSDPEIIAFMQLSPSQQKGKFRALVATKLDNDEIDYLNRINKSHFQTESLDEAMKEIDYSNSKNKIIAGLKTNLIYDMKDRYDYKEDGDKILFFDKKGHHFGTLFDAGTRYQMIQHDGSLDDKGRLSESLDEATTSWSKMMASVRKSETGPWSLVAIKDKKVVAQKNDIRVQDMIPAHFEAMRKEYPNTRIHIEDGTGMVVWNETK